MPQRPVSCVACFRAAKLPRKVALRPLYKTEGSGGVSKHQVLSYLLAPFHAVDGG